MKANADKCHLLVTVNYEVPANINEFKIENSKKEKLLGILTDFQSCIMLHLFVKVACAYKNNTSYGLRKKKFLNESICNIPI